MKHLVKKGSTSRSEYFFIQDASSETVSGLTSVAYNTSGLTAYYVRTRGSATAITLATQTATGSYSSGGFVEVDATNMPGIYRLDVPDACFASGVDKCIIMLKGVTNMVPVTLEYQLTDFDPEDLKGDINDEVLDVINIDTFSEVGQETPASTQTIRKMLAYLYKAWRNKTTQTETTYSLYNDDGETIDQTATVSDDGTTFTRDEIASGS